MRRHSWRWWAPNRFIYISVNTDIFWFHLKVGSLEITIQRKNWPDEEKL